MEILHIFKNNIFININIFYMIYKLLRLYHIFERLKEKKVCGHLTKR